MPAGDTLHSVMKGDWGGVSGVRQRGGKVNSGLGGQRGEREQLLILYYSWLWFNSVCVPVPIYCYLSGRQASFHSCVITPQGGDQKYARQRKVQVCTLPEKSASASSVLTTGSGQVELWRKQQHRHVELLWIFRGQRKRRFHCNVTKTL